MNASEQFVTAIVGWSLFAAVVVAVGTVVWAGLYALVTIPLIIIGL